MMKFSSGTVKYFFKYFIPLIALFGAAFGVFIYSDIQAERKVIEGRGHSIVKSEIDLIATEFLTIVADLLFLNKSHDLLDLLDGTVAVSKDHISQEFRSLSTIKKIYDQVRFLDETGMEIIRVNYDNGNPFIVPENKLQNKSKRYYFRDVITLDQGEVFVSPFDLNVEHGKVELPLKPMLRFGTPTFDRKGRKRGIVLLNYFGNHLLDKLNKLTDKAPGDVMLLNADGYWLKGVDRKDEWGFMFEDRKKRTYGRIYPEAWKQIMSARSGQFYTENGLITFGTIYPLMDGVRSSSGSGRAAAASTQQIASKDYYWKIVNKVPQHLLIAGSRDSLRTSLPIAIFLTLILATFSLKLARTRVVREEAEEAMRESEERFRTLFDRANDAIVVQSDSGQIVSVNLKATQMWHYSKEELQQMYSADLKLDSNSVQILQADDESPFEVVTLTKEGMDVPVEITSSMLKAGGTSLQMLIVRDITVRKEEERKLAEAQQRLIDSNARKAEMAKLATGILHNLKNILNSLNASVEDIKSIVKKSKVKSFVQANQLLEEHIDHIDKFLTIDEKGRKLPTFYLKLGIVLQEEGNKILKDVQRIDDKLNTIKGIIETQQEYARAEYRPEQEDVEIIIEDALKIQKDLIESSGVHITKDYQKPLRCNVDKFRLVQVLLNLVKNAVESMDGNDLNNKTRELTIATGAVDEKSDFLRVTDNGAGIVPENLSKIFTHGFTTKISGHGFGLHNSAASVSGMGGSISVESDGENEGASFVVKLPVQEDSASPD